MFSTLRKLDASVNYFNRISLLLLTFLFIIFLLLDVTPYLEVIPFFSAGGCIKIKGEKKRKVNMLCNSSLPTTLRPI